MTARVNHPRGHSLRGEPTWSDLAGKWPDALPGVDTDSWIRATARPEDTDDVTPFVEQFGGAPQP